MESSGFVQHRNQSLYFFSVIISAFLFPAVGVPLALYMKNKLHLVDIISGAIGMTIGLSITIMLLMLTKRFLEIRFTIQFDEEGLTRINNRNGKEQKFKWSEVKRYKMNSMAAKHSHKQYIAIWFKGEEKENFYGVTVSHKAELSKLLEFRSNFVKYMLRSQKHNAPPAPAQ